MPLVLRKFMTALTLNIPSTLKLTDEQFYQLCLANRDLRLELTAQGELIVMPPTGGGTGRRNSELNFEFVLWNRSSKLGVVFDSSTAFKLPNGAIRSPDVSWVSKKRWESLTPEQQEKFLPLCPEFVLELRSPSDALSDMRLKIQEYLANGSRLGWLIDPQTQQVEIYRTNQEVEIMRAATTLSGEDVLPGLVLELSQLFGI
jgi:Uma2 family endonuclease